MTHQPDEQATPESTTSQPTTPEQSTTYRRARVRRRPRVVPFLATGALLGVVVGMLLSALVGEDPEAGGAQGTIIFGFLWLVLGGVVGAVAFVLADRRSLH